MDESTEIEVYVVNRANNDSVEDKYTLQFGWGENDEELRKVIEGITPVHEREKEDEYELPLWGLNHEHFPTISTIVKLKNDNPMYTHKSASPWFGTTLTLGEVFHLLREDL